MVVQLKHIFRKYYLIIFPLIFAVLAFVGVIYLMHFNRIYYGVDVGFHLGLFNEVKNSIINKQISLFNIHSSLPRGIAQMAYYPWLTLVPMVILCIRMKNAVTIAYSVVGISIFFQYISSFYSYRTIDKNLIHSFLFSLLYTCSGILFDWEIRSMDWGVTLASIFIPMVVIGFINLLRYDHYKMMTIGLIFVIYSHVLSGAMMIVLLIILGAFNIYRFNIKKIMLAIFSAVCVIIATCAFWLPAIILREYNNINTPKPFNKYISFGLSSNIGSPANYCYGLTELIGLLSIIMVMNHKYHWFDIQLWVIGLFCILTNIPNIWDPIQRIIPQLAELQFVYRLSLISHICLSLLAVKFLTGGYYQKPKIENFIPAISILILLFIPLESEINYHFLMHNRPLMTSNNINWINKKIWGPHGKNNRFGQHKSDSSGLKAAGLLSISNLDYNVVKVNGNKNFFELHTTPVFNNHNGGDNLKIIHVSDNNSGVFVNNSNRYYHNIEIPIVIYNHVRYHFLLNGHILSNDNINQRFTHKNQELVVKHLPCGNNKIEIKSSNLENYPQKACWQMLLGVLLLLISLEIKCYVFKHGLFTNVK